MSHSEAMTFEEFSARLLAPEPIHKRIRYAPIRLWRRIRWASGAPRRGWQRARRGYSYADLWSLDGYLSAWLPKALEEMADRAHGHPANLESVEAWQERLREMADGFRAAHAIIDLDYDVTDDDSEAMLRNRWREGSHLFRAWFFHLWD